MPSLPQRIASLSMSALPDPRAMGAPSVPFVNPYTLHPVSVTNAPVQCPRRAKAVMHHSCSPSRAVPHLLHRLPQYSVFEGWDASLCPLQTPCTTPPHTVSSCFTRTPSDCPYEGAVRSALSSRWVAGAAASAPCAAPSPPFSHCPPGQVAGALGGPVGAPRDPLPTVSPRPCVSAPSPSPLAARQGSPTTCCPRLTMGLVG